MVYMAGQKKEGGAGVMVSRVVPEMLTPFSF